MASTFIPFLLFTLITTPLLALSSTPPESSPSPSPDSPADSLPSPAPISPSPASPSPSPSPSDSPISSPPAPPPSDLASPPPASTPSPENSEVPSPAPSPSDLLSDVNHSNNVEAGRIEEDSGSDGMKGGKKAGIAVGVVAVAAVVGVGALVFKKRQDNIRRSQYGYAARRELL